MYFIVFLLVSCSILFLFSLFLLTKDDFVILRKDISIERIFNFAILASLAGLFSARLFYVIFNFQPKFLNLFVFFLFAHFPGLSLVGAVIGGSLFSFVYLKAKKMPALHLFDFMWLSFLPALWLGSLLNLLTIKKVFFLPHLLFPILISLLFVGSLFLYYKARLKEGSVGLLALIFYLIITIVSSHLFEKGLKLVLQKEDLLLLGALFLSLIFLLKQEEFWQKFRRN